MAWSPTPYSLAAFVAVAIALSLAVVTWRHRTEPAARTFGALVVAIGAWAAVYGVQLGFGSPAEQLLWQAVTFSVASTVPPLWLGFALRYAGRDGWLTRPWLAAFALEPLGVTAVSLTNPRHHLMWTGASFGADPSVPVAVFSFGPGYYVHVAYAYLGVAVGVGLVASVAVRAATLHRTQAAVIIAGVLPPFAAHVAYTLGVGPVPGLDLTPFAFALTGACFALALFYLDLLERTPVALRHALAASGDGVVVVDDTGTVVDATDVARSVLDPPPEAGRPAARSLPGADLDDADGRHVEATSEGARRHYDVHVTPLRDHRDRVVGRAVVLRDVTDRRAYERRLEVANRVLRHNVRNGVNVIRGRAASLREGDDPSAAAAAIEERATRLLSASEKAKSAVELDRAAGDGAVAVDVAAVTDRVVAATRASHPDAVVQRSGAGRALATVPDERVVETAVENVVENAVVHSDAAVPRAQVAVTREPSGVTVRVADNGPGLPPVERRVLEAGAETPVEHSRGVGLWLAHWSLSAAGGDLRVDVDESGTTVELAFPAADADPTARAAAADD
ncbi:MAG: histidine kinase N-terminal 7TM domain-containing protein [Halobacteriaceae archaeon]